MYASQQAARSYTPSYVGHARGMERSPWPSTGGESMDKLKAWLDKPTFAADGKVKNVHVVAAGGVVLLAGLAYYGHKHRWF